MLLSVVILVCNVEKSLGLRVMTISCDKHVVMSDEASRDHTLLDVALLGMTNHTKVPLRLATIVGFIASFGSLALAFLYFIAKIIFWNRFALGSAPLIIGFFFLGSVQLFFTGIIGEYLGAVYTQSQKRPLVIERERINC